MEESAIKPPPQVIIIEPFYGGSHKALIDALTNHLSSLHVKFTLVTLPAKKWHWRARCSALQLYTKIPYKVTGTLFCSSVLNLAELLGLRPDLSELKKVVYFHENQLVYPVQLIKERDVQYALNEITSCLACDAILFNSEFNRASFLDNINKVIKLLPDNRPRDIKAAIERKSKVLYFPLRFPKTVTSGNENNSVLHIVWPHRWEFDKGPEKMFNVMLALKESNLDFRISVLGEQFTDNPEIFVKLKAQLGDKILHFGYVESKQQYFNILYSSHVALSTAEHEFFGVSVLEAAYCGCFPLVPNNLVYPEIYPTPCLYNSSDELLDKLKQFCSCPYEARKARLNIYIDFDKYSDHKLLPDYVNVLEM